MTYEADRKTLWNAAADLASQREDSDGTIQYHEKALMDLRERRKTLESREAAIKNAARILGSLDAVGLDIKPQPDAPKVVEADRPPTSSAGYTQGRPPALAEEIPVTRSNDDYVLGPNECAPALPTGLR